jgi:hypothetical protein
MEEGRRALCQSLWRLRSSFFPDLKFFRMIPTILAGKVKLPSKLVDIVDPCHGWLTEGDLDS